MKRILILITLLFATQQANAGFKDGNDLQNLFEECSSVKSGKPTPDASWRDCGSLNGYIAGAFDALHATRAVCSPAITLGQLKAVVENWLKSHPEDWHYAAHSLILDAANEAWPCPD